jgi:DNA replication and repair protein RecF
MFLKKLILQNFRNYSGTTLECNKRGNLLFGRNGQGKTNLLESIYLLSVFRSFRKGTAKDLLKWDESHFLVKGFFDTAKSIEREISIVCEKGDSRQVFYENERVNKLSGLIGTFPTVILSPESLEISQGSPKERRRFLDLCLSNIDPEYLDNLIAYRKVLKHRNSLLCSATLEFDEKTIAPWNEKLVEHGSFIIRRRLDAVSRISVIFEKMYNIISGGSEKLTLEYKSSVADLSDVESCFEKRLTENRQEEARRKATLTGPHKDDIKFILNGHNARKFSSQGQHKTILLALKSAELKYLSETMNIQPVILLDDLFALLDNERIMAFLNILHSYSQFFITANIEIDHDDLLTRAGFQESDFSQYLVENGSIRLK